MRNLRDLGFTLKSHPEGDVGGGGILGGERNRVRKRIKKKILVQEKHL